MGVARIACQLPSGFGICFVGFSGLSSIFVVLVSSPRGSLVRPRFSASGAYFAAPILPLCLFICSLTCGIMVPVVGAVAPAPAGFPWSLA